MPVLWDRSVTATIGPDGGDTSRVGTGPNGERGLDIDFMVSMNDNPEPNSLRLVVWNPGDAVVARAKDDDAVVRLTVGHRGDGSGVVRQVFEGNPVPGGVRYYRGGGGADRYLEIEALDGGRQYARARLAVSFARAVSVRQVFEAISGELQLPLGTIDLDESLEFPPPFALLGPARRELDTLVASMGRRWFVRDGALHVVQAGADTGETAVVFSTTAGNLIGIPSPTDQGVEVRALIAPSLRPGKLFQVDAVDFRGLYRCTDLQFVGSNYGPRFEVVAKGVPKG